MSTPKQILCIDIEATCFENRPPNKFPEQRNEIIEVGITPMNVKTYELGESESVIVLPPTTEVNAFCTQLTTLTPEYVASNGKKFSDAMDYIEKKYRLSKSIFASWGDYDRKSFEKNCKWNGVSNPVSNMVLNVKTLFAAIYGYNGGLDKCAADIGIPFEGTHHRGDADSRMVAKILQKLLIGTKATS